MILEQVNTFTCLGYNISYREKKEIHFKITKLLHILELLNNTLRPNLAQWSTRLKLYITLALLTLLHSGKIWTFKQCDKNRLRTAELKQHYSWSQKNRRDFRRTPCYSFRRKSLYTQTQLVPTHSSNESNRLPKKLLKYHPQGRQRSRRRMKRLLDDVNAETEISHPGLNSWWNMMMIMTTTMAEWNNE
jgi:hypothetical protein